jgi:hypothetical protein
MLRDFLKTFVSSALLALFLLGAVMISSSLSIKEFIDAIKDKEYFGLIYLADKEALEAWR